MLAANSSYGRRGRLLAGTPTTTASAGSPGTFLARPRLPLRNYPRPKLPGSLNYADSAGLARMKRLKAKKVNGVQKMDLSKKKSLDYTEMAYREAVSKLKYLLAESYGPRSTSGKSQGIRNIYQTSNPRINESGEDTDDRSIISDSSRTKDMVGNAHTFTNQYFPSSKGIQPSKAYSNLVLSAPDLQSVPPEITSFIERQEEYIEQLERESQYCRDELTNLLRKVREVVAENEALHNKNKTGFLKCALEEHKTFEDELNEGNKEKSIQLDIFETKKPRVLEGPSIVFESRISELEAQLTQAKLELRKAQEENQANLKRLSESCLSTGGPELKLQLEQALRAKCEAEMKLDDVQKSLCMMRDKEAEATQKAKRSADAMQQIEFEKSQCEAEVRRLKEELDRQHSKIREATQEANRRIAEERQQAERRYSQQVEQLSADIASQWDAANKSQLESEKQRRELTELRRELSQKQAFIDNLKKELQSKISSLQSELNQAITEKDAAEQEVLATKLAAERNDRQNRQEQSRLQTEINSYKQRLERADADLVHCRRENLRLTEQIASLEKEISMIKSIHSDDTRAQAPSRLENEKELTSMIMDMETKHVATVAGLEDALNNQATLVSQLTAECQSLTQRLEANNLKHKEEMASLQSNIEYLSNKIQGTLDNQKEITPNENRGSSVNYNYNTISDNPAMQPHETNLPSDHKNPTIPQTSRQEYNSGSTNERTLNDPQTDEYSNVYQENDKPAEDYSYQNQEYDTKDKLEDTANDPAQEYKEQNGHENTEQKYTTDDQNLASYATDQQYDQSYEQYNPSQYEGQEYVDENQYSSKEHDESQYPTTEMQQNTSYASKPDAEVTH